VGIESLKLPSGSWDGTGRNGEEIFEAYAENKTAAAYRIFWNYGPGKNVITIIAVTPHP